ncbi:transposase family protein [Carnobacteriaceae bacterium zg-ZUI78]|nr:transposase family protein [Carnobacteriaceae bacterium zg-ZUI78]
MSIIIYSGNTHVDKHCFITNRLKQKIMDTLTETISETHIAKQHNVSVHFGEPYITL